MHNADVDAHFLVEAMDVQLGSGWLHRRKGKQGKPERTRLVGLVVRGCSQPHAAAAADGGLVGGPGARTLLPGLLLLPPALAVGRVVGRIARAQLLARPRKPLLRREMLLPLLTRLPAPQNARTSQLFSMLPCRMSGGAVHFDEETRTYTCHLKLHALPLVSFSRRNCLALHAGQGGPHALVSLGVWAARMLGRS